VFWALVFISPVLGLVPFQAQGQSTVADRYAYLPMIGVALLAAGLAARHSRWMAPGLVAMIALTGLRAEVWLKNADFFLDMLANNPQSFVAHSSLGVEYILQNKFDRAEVYLNQAIAMKPMDTIPRTNLAQLYLLLGRPDLVTREVAPLLQDREFLRQNQTETRALSSAYRLTARAHWLQGEYPPANALFCRWYRIDWENEEGKAEFIRFLKDAAERKIALPGCEAVPVY
jgi:tetratricopeptide (TPR) repeat protein